MIENLDKLISEQKNDLKELVRYWIIIARRPGQTLEIARRFIKDNEIWDFVSSRNNKSITPRHAEDLRAGHKVLFYLSKKDQNGYWLGRNSHGVIQYPYPIFFARATLRTIFNHDSEYENFVRLNDVILFPKPIEVIDPKKKYAIGATGPIMLVPIDKDRYESACKVAKVEP